MKLSDFDFDLPEHLIATRPARPRSAARLLLAKGSGIADRHVSDLPGILRPTDRLVLNNTKVIPARLVGTRRRAEAEARIEVTLMEPAPTGWRALAMPLRKAAPGDEIRFSAGLSARVLARSELDLTLGFNLSGEDFDAALAACGAPPLPPYIAARRAPDEQDRTDYQTVFARHAGAVAAPTASLHFDEALLAGLAEMGVEFTEVTLHVGAGTFLPVKAENLDEHRMHAEWGTISADTACALNEAREKGGRIVAVGTTSLRLLESAAGEDGRLSAWTGPTDIFITPGFEFQVVDRMVTNFHLPRSTLMMMISAFAGYERVMGLYQHAIAAHYRFFSYGDAMLLEKKVSQKASCAQIPQEGVTRGPTEQAPRRP